MGFRATPGHKGALLGQPGTKLISRSTRGSLPKKERSFMKLFYKQGGSTGFYISYSEMVNTPKSVGNLNKDFIKAVPGGGESPSYEIIS